MKLYGFEIVKTMQIFNELMRKGWELLATIWVSL